MKYNILIVKKIIQNSILDKFIGVSDEDKVVYNFIKIFSLKKEIKILDIGCGYGRYLYPLRDITNIDILGLDINPEIVEKNRKNGLKCMYTKEFDCIKEKKEYDLLIMSHIIEHFYPDDLLKFLNKYLSYLKTDGYLIIATPLNSPYFYNDFDHIKSYFPTSIEMVFTGNNNQIQYYGDHQLKLEDLWFRRRPLRLWFFPGLYIKKYSQIPRYLNFFLKIFYILSFKLIGITDGWVGFYRKIN